MGYKLLGYLVWRGGKWYARRRFGGLGRKLAIAAAGAALVIGGSVALLAGRRSHTHTG